MASSSWTSPGRRPFLAWPTPWAGTRLIRLWWYHHVAAWSQAVAAWFCRRLRLRSSSPAGSIPCWSRAATPHDAGRRTSGHAEMAPEVRANRATLRLGMLRSLRARVARHARQGGVATHWANCAALAEFPEVSVDA